MAKKTTGPSSAPAADATEQRLVKFAEQLGRIAGTLQARADGWMDRETLNKQIASVRDGAAELIKHLGVGAKTAAKKKPAPPARAAKGRSGGTVDAPGKKHRKPSPVDPDAPLAASQAEKMRAAKTMTKTHQRRGRG